MCVIIWFVSLFIVGVIYCGLFLFIGLIFCVYCGMVLFKNWLSGIGLLKFM